MRDLQFYQTLELQTLAHVGALPNLSKSNSQLLDRIRGTNLFTLTPVRNGSIMPGISDWTLPWAVIWRRLLMTLTRRIALALVVLSCVSLTQAQSKIETLNLTFTTIDVPGAGVTNVSGINTNGDMVGWYSQADNTPASGFLLSGGNFTFLNYPGGYDTVARSINDSGVIAGYSGTNHDAAYVGFTYAGGTFTTVKVGNYVYNYAEGIDNFGDVVGGYGNLFSNNGFEENGTKFKNITPPGSWQTVVANGVNNVGQVVGSATSATSVSMNGFFYNKGKFQALSVPGSNGTTTAMAINDDGIVVGSYFACNVNCGYQGFAFMKGKYLSFHYPGSTDTFPLGINSLGQVVGNYIVRGDSIEHGFVTSPVTALQFAMPASPEPR